MIAARIAMLVAFGSMSTAHADPANACFAIDDARKGYFTWSADPTPRVCLTDAKSQAMSCIDLADDAALGFVDGSRRPKDPPAPGGHVVSSVDKGIEICEPDDPTRCHRVQLQDLGESEFVSTAVNYEGSEVAFLRRGYQQLDVYLEIYDVVHNNRTSRKLVEAPSSAHSLLMRTFAAHWIGNYIYLGDGDRMLRLELTRSSKSTINAESTRYRRGAFVSLSKDLVAMVTPGGTALQFLDGVHTAPRLMSLPRFGRDEPEVQIFAYDGEVYLLYQSAVREAAKRSVDATVLRIDPTRRKMSGRMSLLCPSPVTRR